MAIMIPSIPNDYAPESREGELFTSLQKLSNDYYVFHSFRIINVTNDDWKENEIDFVIFNRHKGIICLEAKAGRVQCIDGQWYYASGREMRDPFGQANSNKWKLNNEIYTFYGNNDILKHCKMLCAVWFPALNSHKLSTLNLPQNAPKEIILTADDLDNPTEAIERIFNIQTSLKEYGNMVQVDGNLTKDEANSLLNNILCPSFNILPSKTLELDYKRERFNTLIKEQCNLLDYLEEQRSAVINGAAGTGKTMIAIEKARNYEDIVRQECKILVDIGDVFCKSFNKNYTSDTLASMSLLMGEMCTDKLLGLCEQVKSKWKIVLELCASFYECYITPSLHEERFMLLEEHEHLQTQRNLGESCSVNQAYSIYKTLYPNGVNIDLFEKNFLTTCGYTIDEKGVAKSLTGIVKEFIKKFSTAKAPISLDRAMLLDYIESQMISHANGYMWYANSGSWGDVNNVIIGADICVIFLLESILTVFKIHRAIDESNQYKQIINIVRNSIKRIRALSEEKAKILKIHGIII